MGGLALLAQESGFRVSGSDRNIYPPMSDQLAESGIPLTDGYGDEQLVPEPDCVVVGNALSRGLPVVEATLNRGLSYASGPEWLGQHILRDRWVLAVGVLMAKPVPPACWLGFWTVPGSIRVF